MKRFSVGFVLCLTLAAAAAAQGQFGVTVVEQKKVDFAKFKTYSWGRNPTPAAMDSADKQVVAAIDRELKALGLAKTQPGPGDVVVTYSALRRSDVDVKSAPAAGGMRAQVSVGTLSVTMLEPGTQNRLLELRLDKPIDTDPAQAQALIDKAVAELFTKYPTRQKP